MNLKEYVEGLVKFLEDNPELSDKQVVGFKSSQELLVKTSPVYGKAYVLENDAYNINNKIISYSAAYDNVSDDINHDVVVLI